MKNLKFDLGVNHDPKVSVQLQSALFILGYRWKTKGKDFRHLDKRFIYAESTGILTQGSGIDAFYKRNPQYTATNVTEFINKA